MTPNQNTLYAGRTPKAILIAPVGRETYQLFTTTDHFEIGCNGRIISSRPTKDLGAALEWLDADRFPDNGWYIQVVLTPEAN